MKVKFRLTETAGARYCPQIHVVDTAPTRVTTRGSEYAATWGAIANLPLPAAEEREDARVRRRLSPGASAIVVVVVKNAMKKGSQLCI